MEKLRCIRETGNGFVACKWGYRRPQPSNRCNGFEINATLASSSLQWIEVNALSLENPWSGVAVLPYRAAEPSRPGKDVPLYTV
jgi:hypothetical protein